MPLPVTLALSAIAALLLLIVLLRWARRGMAAARANLTEVAAGRTARRQAMAQSFGIRSKGVGQWRGSGELALFEDELVFVQAFAENHIRAKLSDIVGVTTPRSFLGKTQGAKLLAVEWRAGAVSDQVAFRVADLDGWVAALGGVTAAKDV